MCLTYSDFLPYITHEKCCKSASITNFLCYNSGIGGFKMLNKVFKILGMLCSLFFLVLTMAFIKEGISWIFFLGLSALCNPFFMGFLNKKNKKPKAGIQVILFIVLFVLGMIFSPNTIPYTNGNTKLTNNRDSITKGEKESLNNSKENQSKSDENMDGDSSVEDSHTLKNNPSDRQITSDSGKRDDTNTEVSTKSNPNNTSQSSSFSKVHFIHVGQGDSILIEADGHYMLIDAGENNQGTTVVNYLKEQGVKKLDYVIGTHPHSDHIGGLDVVINSFDIGKVILPDIIHTTKTFEDVLDAIAENTLKISKAVVGNTYSLGGSSFTIVAPNASDYDELNDYSVGVKFTNGENSFLFTGDAEKLSEIQMLRNGIDLTADVLKLGHHGSSTSSHDNFMDEVDPDYAVISVGEDNSYGHPHKETLEYLKDKKIKVYRTDKQNTIIFTSDGENITVNKAPYTITQSELNTSNTLTTSDKKEDTRNSNTDNSTNSYTSSNINTNNSNKLNNNNIDKSNSDNIIVHITNTGSKYHAAGCRYLKSDIEVTLDEALSNGLEPCSTCNPPTN